MNYRRWAVVGFVTALAIFSFWHLSNAGSEYRFLTTSDSGFFHGIADDIDQQDGFIEEYELSRPPQGKSVGKKNQFQPLMMVALYRGVHTIDSSVSLRDISQYFSPFIFALSLIGAFLAARELGGDLAGCASALFFSTLVGSIYWTKIGALDREITLIFFSTWLFYIFAKTFHASKREMLKSSALGGILYGMFLTTWGGAPFIAAILVLALALIVFEKAVSGLGLTLVGIGLLVLGHGFSDFDVTELIGIFIFLAGLVEMGINWEALENLENRLISSFRSNLKAISGVLSMIGIATLIGIILGGTGSDLWLKLFMERIPEFAGLGGGEGVSFPGVATEMGGAPAEPGKYLDSLTSQLYRNSTITGITIMLVATGLLKTVWSSRRRELLAFAALLIIIPMPISQARFFRLFWPIWPVLAGFGFGALIWMIKRIMTSPGFSTSVWLDRARKPMVLALVSLLLIVPFFQNVRKDRNASEVAPATHGGSLPTVYYNSLLDSFEWIKENTPENSTLAIPWSYGHFATGATGRYTVTDGATSGGWKGEWENSPGPKPPDYIKYISGGEGKIVGKPNPRPYQINGRRIDMQRMQSMTDENEFRWLVNTYRENFSVDMDYIVFNNYVSRGMSFYYSVLFTLQEDLEKAKSVSRKGRSYVLQFEEENVEFSMYGFPTTQKNNERLGGMVLLDAETGRLMNYSFTPSPDLQKILWVSYKRGESRGQGQVVGGALAKFEGVPMIMRALKEKEFPSYEMPGYLRQVHHAPSKWGSNNRSGPDYQAAVYKVARIPKPESPENKGLTNDNTPRFEWAESIDGVKYEISIDDDPGFESPEILENVSGSSYVPDEILPDGNYYWRVRGFNEDNETHGWSSVYTFELDTVPPESPNLQSPEDGSSLSDNNVQFDWSAVSEAESYQIQIDNDEDFESVEKEKMGVTEESYQVPGSGLENGNYYWRVRAADSAGNKSTWSEIRSFTVSS